MSKYSKILFKYLIEIKLNFRHMPRYMYEYILLELRYPNIILQPTLFNRITVYRKYTKTSSRMH